MDMTRSLLNMVKCIRNHTQVWAETVNTANYLRSRLVTSSGNVTGKTPYEAFTGNKVIVSHLRAFSAKAYVHVQKKQCNGKPSNQASIGTMLGYNPGNFYRILITTNFRRRVIVSKDVTYDEGMSHQHEGQPKVFVQSNTIPTLLKDIYIGEKNERDSIKGKDNTVEPSLLKASATSSEDTLQASASVESEKDFGWSYLLPIHSQVFASE